jgi:predicted transcriptional regulator
MHLVTVELSDREMFYLEAIAKEKDLSPSAVMRQALRIYQLAATLEAAFPFSDSPGCGVVE